jgi:uncharacterized protein
MADDVKDGRRGEPEDGVPRRGMTVSEAGRKGGIAVRDERGHAFYEEIGRKGGQKVRELIQRGKSRAAREEPE